MDQIIPENLIGYFNSKGIKLFIYIYLKKKKQ
jgi:hypothetical protein